MVGTNLKKVLSHILGCVLAAGLLGQAQAQEQHRTSRRPPRLQITSFYDTPKPLPAGKAGDLIRTEEYGGYEFPYGITVKRILYHTLSASGQDVASSGVVILPHGKAPGSGWPVIAWAHDFTGTARKCAPSLMRNLSQGPLLSMYVHLGYAVVVTDYAGLGADSRNAGVDLPSNATDVIYAVPAARAAAPALGSRWVTMGKGHGALVAVAVAEAEGKIRDANYLGSVALSGIADLRQIYQGMREPSPAAAAALAYSVKAVYPEFRIEEILSPKALPIYASEETECSGEVRGPAPPAGALLQPGWKDNKLVRQFFKRNSFAQEPAFAPLLVVSGGADPAIGTRMIDATVAQLCRRGDRVQWYDYPGLDAGELIGTSVRDPITWLQGRFAGRQAPTSCR
jgi:alpha-beta hydrolase superfamily lysophospholipase